MDNRVDCWLLGAQVRHLLSSPETDADDAQLLVEVSSSYLQTNLFFQAPQTDIDLAIWQLCQTFSRYRQSSCPIIARTWLDWPEKSQVKSAGRVIVDCNSGGQIDSGQPALAPSQRIWSHFVIMRRGQLVEVLQGRKLSKAMQGREKRPENKGKKKCSQRAMACFFLPPTVRTTTTTTFLGVRVWNKVEHEFNVEKREEQVQ